MATTDKQDRGTVKRRDFMKMSAGAGAAMMAAPMARAAVSGNPKKRYAIVGVGSRSGMYRTAIERDDYKQYGEMVGFCDINRGRLERAQRHSEEWTGKKPPIYMDTEFDKMVEETNPDTIIVTTSDGFHHKYIIRGMELGCDVITEKPMTIDAPKCQQIIDTQRKTGKTCTVTFNYRYSPPRTQIKDILMSGEIGEVLSVDFHWLLNTHHGADYFRRWHSDKDISGGLMVHKATHHFDLMNWWLSATPVSVYATGKKEFYTPTMAKRFGLDSSHERCLTCTEKDKCTFQLDLRAHGGLKELYLDNEKFDGYFRDKCVFRPEISIEDTMNVLVTYDNNVSLTYSLEAYNSWEGYYIAFNGTKGRIEHGVQEGVYINGLDTTQGAIKEGGVSTRVIPLRGAGREVKPWEGVGGHGGGDKRLLDDLFLPDKQDDPYLRSADQRAGAYSILTGVAANECFRTGKLVRIDDLVKKIGRPEFPEMPSRTASLPMPGTESS